MNSQREYSQLYRMGRTLWLFLGLAWLSTVIAAKQNTIQEFINKEELKYKSHERQKALVRFDWPTHHGEDIVLVGRWWWANQHYRSRENDILSFESQSMCNRVQNKCPVL